MSQADAQAPPPKPQTFKSRYRLHGMIGAMAVMWLDFAYIYHALASNDPGALTTGMAIMLAGAAMAYYFG